MKGVRENAPCNTHTKLCSPLPTPPARWLYSVFVKARPQCNFLWLRQWSFDHISQEVTKPVKCLHLLIVESDFYLESVFHFSVYDFFFFGQVGYISFECISLFWYWQWNSGPCLCKAGAVALGYIPRLYDSTGDVCLTFSLWKSQIYFAVNLIPLGHSTVIPYLGV